MAVESNDHDRSKCLCPHCPTYTICMAAEEEALFCGTSVTMCEDVERQGCVCGRCDVRRDYDLMGTYYCLEGPAA
jgi:hypothetical protein